MFIFLESIIDCVVLQFTINTLWMCILLLFIRFYFYNLTALTPLFFRVTINSFVSADLLSHQPYISLFPNMISIYPIKKPQKPVRISLYFVTEDIGQLIYYYPFVLGIK